MAHDVAHSLSKNPQAAEQIVEELKRHDTGDASRLVSKITNTTGNMTAGRDNFNFQGAEIKTRDHTKFGGS
jgi:hypothetical protein